MNGDGTIDLITSNGGMGIEGDRSGELACSAKATLPRGGVSVLAGRGNGTFQHPVNYYFANNDFCSVAMEDFDGDGDQDLALVNADGVTLVLNSLWSDVSSQPGDANRDGEFNQLDIVQILQSAKFLTGEPASWSEGDWNADGAFDQHDIIAALQTGNYLQGPYLAGIGV